MSIINAVPRVLRNFNLYLSAGLSWAGKVDEVTLPKISMKQEEYRCGGMDIPDICDQGMEGMDCSMTVLEYDEAVMKEYGILTGTGASALVKLRGAIVNNSGTTVKVEVDMTGVWTDIDMGTWKSGENSPLSLTLGVGLYKLKIGGDDIYEIDPGKMVRKIGGTDELLDQKDAISK